MLSQGSGKLLHQLDLCQLDKLLEPAKIANSETRRYVGKKLTMKYNLETCGWTEKRCFSSQTPEICIANRKDRKGPRNRFGMLWLTRKHQEIHKAKSSTLTIKKLPVKPDTLKYNRFRNTRTCLAWPAFPELVVFLTARNLLINVVREEWRALSAQLPSKASGGTFKNVRKIVPMLYSCSLHVAAKDSILPGIRSCGCAMRFYAIDGAIWGRFV